MNAQWINMKALAVNKRAMFDYEILDTFEAGLKLLGIEVKSVKEGNMSIKGAFVTTHGDEVYLVNSYIPPWQVKNSPNDFDPERSRKLLMKRSEINSIVGIKREKGLTLVPLRVYNKGAWIKIEVGLAKGKKIHSKKQLKKERDILRDTERFLRGKE